ncbi:MAG: GntR family transcriptional regulator [Bryobacterales bacterium]
MTLPTIAPATRVDLVRQAILQHIFNGDLNPGDRLVEATVAKQLGVSQATVNSALQDLHAQGIVTKVLNRATRVSRYGQAEIEAMFTVRMILEPAAAEAAAANIGAKGAGGLQNCFEQMLQAAKVQDLSRFCLADYGFHQEIYRLSCNRFLIQACQAIAAAPFAYILCNCHEPLPTDYVALANDHQEIINVLKAGPQPAGEFMRQKIATWRGWSIRALERQAQRLGGTSTAENDVLTGGS